MSTIDLLLYGQLAASAVMIVGWVIALLIKNTSYVDVLWAYGVGVLGISFLVIQSDQCHPFRLAVLEGILCGLVPASGHSPSPQMLVKPEDARYAYLREYLGKNANLGFYLFSGTGLLDRSLRISLFDPCTKSERSWDLGSLGPDYLDHWICWSKPGR